jgi:uncharacterized protein (TIGR02145 family)
MKNSLLAVFTFVFLSISLNSTSQDYLITFAGTGASATISTVEVENLATGKSLNLNGGDTLRLTSDNVGISQLEKINLSMNIYPNPMMDNSTLVLQSPAAGDAVITLYEMTGKTVAQIHTYFENYKQEFNLTGLKNGLYLINVSGNTFQYSGKILCNGHMDGNLKIEKVSNTSESNFEKISKKEFNETKGTVDLRYTAGDKLRFTSISGIYSTVMTDSPSSDKTITFNLVECKDGSNNNYPVVEIGTQKWMKENLKTTQYNNGTVIPLVTDAEAWASLVTPGYCWLENDPATYGATYGALYNWYTVNTGKLCPTGWHVPAEAEWTVLTDYLGGEGVAGGKIKEAGLTHWDNPNQDATNESGFSALPGGLRSGYGTFKPFGTGFNGVWWSSNEGSNPNNAWGRELTCMDGYFVGEQDLVKQFGFSVRCLKDE